MRKTHYLPAAACCLIMACAANNASAAEAEPAKPGKGMSMEQVERDFGHPRTVLGPVGDPPITRWVYEGYTVYFDQTHVIHSVTHTQVAGNEANATR